MKEILVITLVLASNNIEHFKLYQVTQKLSKVNPLSG